MGWQWAMSDTRVLGATDPAAGSDARRSSENASSHTQIPLRRVPDRRDVGAVLDCHDDIVRHFDLEEFGIVGRPAWLRDLDRALVQLKFAGGSLGKDSAYPEYYEPGILAGGGQDHVACILGHA